MNFLKRFEFWILLLLVGGVIAFVIAMGGNDHDADPTGNGAGSASTAGSNGGETVQAAAFTVDRSLLKRDVGNAVLEIHITCRNDSARDLELSSPTARLLSGAEDSTVEVKAFFLAFSPPPIIPAGNTSAVVLKFWLEKEHLEDALWLRIREDVVPVKSATPLDLESLPDQEQIVFKGTDWTVPT